MTESVWIIGAHSTSFGKKPDLDYKTLARETYEGVLADAGLESGADIDAAWFGNTGMHTLGQSSIRGQVCFIPLVREGRFPERVPLFNVENACATGTTAIHAASNSLRSGESRLALAMGVEKMVLPGRAIDPLADFIGGADALDHEEWVAYLTEAGRRSGKAFETGPGRSIFMDSYAMQAVHHMRRYGTTQRQIAIAAAKTHCFGAANPLSQYRFEMTAEQVLADRLVSYPLTRAMCAPIGDGGAAVLMCTGDFLRGLDQRTRTRAVRIRSIGAAGGKYRELNEPGLSRIAAERAYRAAGLVPADVDVAEVHDATSFAEIYQSEMLDFCAEGRGGAFIEAGGGTLEGRPAINTSGGLISKGHPIGATGCSMVYELVVQLRGEAGIRQKPGARIALAENGGGAIGFDDAICFVTLLERS